MVDLFSNEDLLECRKAEDYARSENTYNDAGRYLSWIVSGIRFVRRSASLTYPFGC